MNIEHLVARLKWWLACSSSLFLWLAIAGGLRVIGTTRLTTGLPIAAEHVLAANRPTPISRTTFSSASPAQPAQPLTATRSATPIPTALTSPTPQPTTLPPDILAELEVETFNHPVVEVISPSEADKQGQFIANGSNVRAGPGLEYEVIAIVEPGTKIEPRSTVDGWYKVRLGTTTGWIKSTLVHNPTVATPNPIKPPLQAQHVGQAKSPPEKSPSTTIAQPHQDLKAQAAPIQPDWSLNLEPGTLVKLPGVIAPQPMLIADAARPFLRARARILQATGIDYLGRLDDAFRSVSFETDKPGVVSQSWHKAGRAVDLASSRIVGGVEGVAFVRDPASRGLYRIFLRCIRQDGSMGTYYAARKVAGRNAGYYVDITSIMLSENFQRIPPTSGVSEAWHYEYHSGLKWSTAMRQLYKLGTLRRLYPSIWR